jgi:hypothetical protein
MHAEIEKRILGNRIQVGFLPRDETEATMDPIPQPSLHVKRPNATHQYQEQRLRQHDEHANGLGDSTQPI